MYSKYVYMYVYTRNLPVCHPFHYCYEGHSHYVVLTVKWRKHKDALHFAVVQKRVLWCATEAARTVLVHTGTFVKTRRTAF